MRRVSFAPKTVRGLDRQLRRPRRGAAAVEAETAAWVAVLDARARWLEDTFERELRGVYEVPATARDQFDSVAHRSGAEHTVKVKVCPGARPPPGLKRIPPT